MMFWGWAMLVILGLVTTTASLLYGGRFPFVFIASALVWATVAFTSVDIGFTITYLGAGYDYEKAFTYPYLTLFFGLVSGLHALVFGGALWDYLEVEEVFT